MLLGSRKENIFFFFLKIISENMLAKQVFYVILMFLDFENRKKAFISPNHARPFFHVISKYPLKK